MAVVAGDTLVYNVSVVGKNTTAGVNKVVADIGSINRRTRRPMSLVRGSFLKLGTSITSVTGKVAAFARRYTAMLTTVAGAAVIFKSVGDAQRFGLGIAEIGTIFRGTAEELDAVEDALLGVSEQLGLQETIVAKGFYQIISSNITDAAEAMTVLDAATKLATVGLADVKDTIDVVTSVIKAYNTNVGEAARISDILFKTVVLGKITIPELATSLGQVLPIAATLGIRLEEVTAAIATLTQGGIDPNTAVIQLRQAFNQLLKLTPVARQTLASYGLEVNATTLKNEGLVVTLGKIRSELGTNAEAYSKVFGNIRALIPVLALTGDRWEEFQQVLRETDDTTIGLGKSLDQFLQNPFKRFQIFLNAIRLQLRKVGETFIREINKIIEEKGGVKAIVDTLTAGFGGLDEVAKGVANGLKIVIEQMQIFAKSVGGLEGAKAIFRSVGEVVSSVFRIIVTGVTTAVQVIAQALVELPTLIDGIVRRFKVAANDFQKIKNLNPLGDKEPLPFPSILPTESELKSAIDDEKRRLDRYFAEKEKLEAQIAAGRGGSRSGRQLDILNEGIRETRSIRSRLRSELRSGEFIEDLQTTLGRIVDTGAGLDAANLLNREGFALQDAFNGLTDTLMRAREGLVKEAALPFAVDLAFEYAVNPAVEAANIKKAFEESIRRVEGQEILAETLALKVGIELDAQPSSIDPKNIEPAIAEIREAFSNATGLFLAGDIDQQNFFEIQGRLEGLLRLHAELDEEIGGTTESQVIFNETLNRLGRENEIEKYRQELQLTEPAVDALTAKIREAQVAAQAAALGFQNFVQFARDLGGDANIPIQERLGLLERIRQEDLAAVGRLVALGKITAAQAASLKSIIEDSFVRGVQDETIATGTFVEGLSARLQQLASDVRSAGQIGAQVADDIQGSLQNAFQTGLSAAILGASDAFDQFRVALARGIADAVAAAIAQSLVNNTIASFASALGGAAGGSLGGGGGGTDFGGNLGGANSGVTARFAEGGIPKVAYANGGITQRVTPRLSGGIKRVRTLAEVSERAPEAVVPLPGNNRSIPVEFRGGERSGGSVNQTLTANLTLNVTSDDRMFTQKVAEQMPAIERMLAATLSQGANRSLQTAVRSAGRGA